MFEYVKVNMIDILLKMHPEIFSEDVKKHKTVVAETKVQGEEATVEERRTLRVRCGTQNVNVTVSLYAMC